MIKIIFGVLVILFIALAFNLMFTHIAIWVIKSLAGIDWSMKYWQVFWGMFILSSMFKSSYGNK